MKLTIEGYEVDTLRRDQVVYAAGGLVCSVAPWEASGCPLTLELCICPDGTVLNRGWDWSGKACHYLHVDEQFHKWSKITVTEEMRDAVAGLFSGRITVDGLKIAVGATVQRAVGGIDLAAEETRIGQRILLANVTR